MRITHEKIRCPLLRRGLTGERKMIQDRVQEEMADRSMVTPPQPKVISLQGPPGYPLLFPELSNEDRKMAMLYISHSDKT